MNPPSHTQNGQQPGEKIGLDDVLYTIFRHKKVILAFLLLALLSVPIVYYSFNAPRYQSRAKLLIKYVIDQRDITPVRQETQIREPEPRNATILSSEAAILTSLDLAKRVVDIVGAERILGGGANPMTAAAVVNSGVRAVQAGKSDVMIVSFEHSDRSVVEPVLDALLQAYQRRHNAIRGGVFDESFYSEQVGRFKDKLKDTEDELRRVMQEANVLDVAQAKQTLSSQIESLKSELNVARAALFERQAILGEHESNAVETNALDTIPAEKLDLYAAVLGGMNQLRKRELELLIAYTQEHPLVTATREKQTELRNQKESLEKEYPNLALSDNGADGINIAAERAQLRALAAKVSSNERLLKMLQEQGGTLLTLSPQINELERRRQVELRNYESVLEKLTIERQNASTGDKVTGIVPIESPTPGAQVESKILAIVGGVFGGILALGILYAALVDFVFDKTIKRPVDARRHLRLPFVLAIPQAATNGHARKRRFPLKLPFTTPKEKKTETTNGHHGENGENGGIVPAQLNGDLSLREHMEGLRERLITYFEVNGLNHKPKLVGVTSCGEGAGVTTMATGIAAALSKTGDGNVLLVDMKNESGGAHPFYRGKPGCGIGEVLEGDSRREAKISDRLFHASMQAQNPKDNVVSSHEEKVNSLLPVRLNKIMPRLKASDYDYIIFDMPPVTPRSPAPRFASNMDMVLLVVEAEKTSQHCANRAIELLAEARANAAVVLNKFRHQGPKMLSHDS